MDKKIGVYILRCNNGRYYIGSTNDLDRRMLEHKNGRVMSTKNIRPIALEFFYPCDSIYRARIVEKKLKSKKSKVIIEQIIKDGGMRFLEGVSNNKREIENFAGPLA